MADLIQKSCVPCEGGVQALSRDQATALLNKLSGWELSLDAGEIHQTFRFEDFHQTMDFVNRVAEIAHQEDHHPDLVVGYNRCEVHYRTHAIGGLSENDFICAAKIDALLQNEMQQAGTSASQS
jgi:4a-hydroxytetrahydrobiopterin dehydratase